MGFVDGHTKWDIVAREVNFGAAVAPTFWSKRLAIETTTNIYVSVLIDLMYVWHFQCEIVFLSHRVGMKTCCGCRGEDVLPQVRMEVRAAESVQHTSKLGSNVFRTYRY